MYDSRIHLGSVHFPVALGIISMLLVIFALITKNSARLKFACKVIVIGALLSWAPYQTGEGAEDKVEAQPGINDVYLKYYIREHEHMAERAHIAFQVTGGIALLGWLFCCKAGKFNMPAGVLFLLATGTTAGLMGGTGHLGGQARHTERRPVDAPQPDGAGSTAPAPDGKETDDDDH